MKTGLFLLRILEIVLPFLRFFWRNFALKKPTFRRQIFFAQQLKSLLFAESPPGFWLANVS